MQVFKTAIKTVLRHPMYLIVYAGFLSMMGVFIASGLTFGGTNDSEFSPYETKFAVIDRDGSALSDGLAAYLREQGIEVPIEDSQMALQDAVAKGQSSYILIVPEGFGDAFVEAARTGDELPTLETVYSFYSTEGSLMDQMVNSYLGIAGAYAGLEGSASQGDIVQHAAEAMAESAETDSVEVGGTSSEAQRFVFFLQWGTYTLFASIIVCVGVMMTTLNRTDLRRRNLVSPLPSLSYGLQLAASSLLVMTAVWLWTICLGFTVFHEATSMISGPGLALMVAASFVFATIPLSVGYLLGQLGVGEFASNALGNVRPAGSVRANAGALLARLLVHGRAASSGRHGRGHAGGGDTHSGEHGRDAAVHGGDIRGGAGGGTAARAELGSRGQCRCGARHARVGARARAGTASVDGEGPALAIGPGERSCLTAGV